MLHLQRTLGNQGVHGLLNHKARQFDAGTLRAALSKKPSNNYAMSGLKLGVGENEMVGGRRVGKFIGDVARPTPRYWEAWAVDGAGYVTPNDGVSNDYWIRVNRGNNTQGHWSVRGKVYFTTTDPSTQGFTPGDVADAGILLSTTAASSGLGIARLHRYAQSTWDSTGARSIHSREAVKLCRRLCVHFLNLVLGLILAK